MKGVGLGGLGVRMQCVKGEWNEISVEIGEPC